MMVCSDETLRIIKEAVKSGELNLPEFFQALLARLEAAELIVRQGESEHGWRTEYTEWRKAAGKND